MPVAEVYRRQAALLVAHDSTGGATTKLRAQRRDGDQPLRAGHAPAFRQHRSHLLARSGSGDIFARDRPGMAPDRATAIGAGIPGVRGASEHTARGKLHYQTDIRADDVQIKIEVTPVLRGCVYKRPQERSPRVEDQFGFAEIPLGPLCRSLRGQDRGGLDRQHPRDLFDVRDCWRTKGSRTVAQGLHRLPSQSQPADVGGPRAGAAGHLGGIHPRFRGHDRAARNDWRDCSKPARNSSTISWGRCRWNTAAF